MRRLNNLPELKNRRKKLRREETRQEGIIWWHLKDRNLGYKFKRQHSLGGYILDFYCAEKKVVVEIDGGIHNTKDSKKYDAERDNFLENLGYLVLRFSNIEVDNDIFKVLTKIQETLKGV